MSAAQPDRNDGLVTQRKFMLKRNIAAISGDRVDTISVLPNRGDRVLSFFVPKTSNRLVNLSGISMHLKIRLVSGMEGKPLNTNYKYIIPGFIPSTIFSSLSIRVNETEITNSNQHPLLTKFLFMTRIDPARRRLLQEVNEFAEDWDETVVGQRLVKEQIEEEIEVTADEEEAEGNAETPAQNGAKRPKKRKVKKKVTRTVEKLKHHMSRGNFENLGTRSRRFTREGGRGMIHCSTFLLTELTGGGGSELVLPPCDLALDFYPADPGRCILTDHPNPDVRVEIVSAFLTVPRIQPKTERILGLRWNFLRTRIQPLIVPKDRSEFHAVLVYNGVIGRRISMFVLEEDGWNGTYRSSIYRSYNFNIESVELRLGSRILPHSRIRTPNYFRGADGEQYMFVLDALKHSLRRTMAYDMVSRRRWAQGGYVWAADTTLDMSADAGFRGAPQTGSVSLSVTFSTKTPQQLVLAVVLESTSELRVAADGAVSLDE